jgi:hypothetical protein
MDTESMRNIIDPLQREIKETEGVHGFNRSKDSMGKTQTYWMTEPPSSMQFKKQKVDVTTAQVFENPGDDQVKLVDIQTTESWMNYPMSIFQYDSENMKIPRKISDIPVINSTKRGSLIMYGGEMTPGQRRSLFNEGGLRKENKTKRKLDLVEEGDVEEEVLEIPVVTSEVDKEPEPVQNINDLMKMIIKKTQNLPPVKETPSPINETCESQEPKVSIDVFNENRTKEVQNLGKSEHPEIEEEVKSDKINESDVFDSSLTNMPSTVNIESTANMQTIFDINFDPGVTNTRKDSSGQQVNAGTSTGTHVRPDSSLFKIRRSKTRSKNGSMLSDEKSSRSKSSPKVFRVVSISDEAEESELMDRTDSILLMPNKDIAQKRSTDKWETSGARYSELDLESHMNLQSIDAGVDHEEPQSWRDMPKPPIPLVHPINTNFFKKPQKIFVPKQDFQKIMKPHSKDKKRKYRNSKLGLKITRISRKAARHEPFKLRSPTTHSITNHTDVSGSRKKSPTSLLKDSLKGSKQKMVSEKLWESIVSSKKNCSVDMQGRFDKTLGSISIQSLPRKATETSVQTLNPKKSSQKIQRNRKAKGSTKMQKYSRPKYINKYLYKMHTNEVNNVSQEHSSLKQKAANDKPNSSRLMKSSVQERSSIYSKMSSQEVTHKVHKMRRSNTVQNENNTQNTQTFNTPQMRGDFGSKGPVQEVSQRELNADILRKRNKKGFDVNLHDIYNPRNLKVTKSIISFLL